MDKVCGNCAHYKGAQIKCGQSKYLTPQRATDHCQGRYFKEKPVVQPLSPPMPMPVPTKDLRKAWGENFKERDNLALSFKSSELCKEIVLSDVTEICSLSEGIDFETTRLGLGIKNRYYASPSQRKKENNMNSIIRLADSQLAKQIEDFGGLQLDIREALEEMQKEEQKTAALQAAKEVMDVLKAANNSIEYQVAAIRDARKREQRAKEHISALNKAKAYGKATNNFVPLSILLGLVYEHQVENKELLKIDESKLPEGWDKKGE